VTSKRAIPIREKRLEPLLASTVSRRNLPIRLAVDVIRCAPLHKSPPALSYAIIGVRLGDRGSHHDTKGRFSGFMRVEPEARPRGIAAPRRCTLTVDGGGAADAATGLHRALRVRSGRTVAVAGEVADLQSA
jgi:hypothetical protein